MSLIECVKHLKGLRSEWKWRQVCSLAWTNTERFLSIADMNGFQKVLCDCCSRFTCRFFTQGRWNLFNIANIQLPGKLHPASKVQLKIMLDLAKVCNESLTWDLKILVVYFEQKLRGDLGLLYCHLKLTM